MRKLNLTVNDEFGTLSINDEFLKDVFEDISLLKSFCNFLCEFYKYYGYMPELEVKE